SWMHQREWGCRMVGRKLLKRARVTSVEEVPARGLAFGEDCHPTMAQPVPWTSGQKPLHGDRMWYFCPAVLAITGRRSRWNVRPAPDTGSRWAKPRSTWQAD